MTGEIENLTVPLAQSSLIVLCAGSTLLLTPVVCPANVSGINLQKTHFLLLVDSTLVSRSEERRVGKEC